ncbi:MAG: polyphenol oxidase family protein [Acidimicrobiales bacterium]
MPVEVTLQSEVRGSLTVYPIDSARDFGVDAFVTDRFHGTSGAPYDSLNLGDHVGDDPGHVAANRRLVAQALGVERLVIVRQIHGAALVDARRATSTSEADALFDDGDHALAVLVADCIPILMVDGASSRFGVVHAGWRGLAEGVITRAIQSFSDPATVRVFLGPSISLAGYQVGPEVADVFRSVPDALVDDGGDRSRMDLRLIAAHELVAAGVDDRHIERSVQVTDGGALFFSDRAQRPCGRFGLVAKRVS